MARRRFFVDAVQGGLAELRGEDALHLTRVLRAESGQRFEISDQRTAWLAEIVEARGPRVVFRVIEPVNSTPLPVRLTLIAAIVKFDRFEWMVEKATELAVERIVPMEAARTEKGLGEGARKRRERWQRIAREAGQQSRRVSVPEIAAPVSCDQALREAADLRYLLEENGAPPLLSALPAARRASDRVALMLGPEGGWTEEERRGAAASGWQPVWLGPLVLRAETAAVAALAVLGSAWLAAEKNGPPNLTTME